MTALLDTVLAAAVAVRISRWNVSLAIVISLIAIAVWTLSRTAGLPFGPGSGTPETVGTPDLVATGMEMVTAAALLVFSRLPVTRMALSPAARNVAIALSCVAFGASTWVGLQIVPQCGPAHGSQ